MTVTFCDLITFDVRDDREPVCAETVRELIEDGKAPTTLHRVTEHMRQFEQVNAIETDLIAARVNGGWTFVVGSHAEHRQVRGWLVSGEHVIVPYGPKAQDETGMDIGVWRLEDWAEGSTVLAAADADEGSAINLNAQLRDQGKRDFYEPRND